MARILRTWTFWVQSGCEEPCQAFLDAHVLPALREQIGCHRATALLRTREDATVEVVVASLWRSMADIEAYRGARVSQPVGFSPTYQSLLVDREPRVSHSVVDGDGAALEVLLRASLTASD